MKITKLSFLAFAASLLGQSQLFAQATWIGIGTAEAPALWSNGANWTGTAPVNDAAVALTFGNTTVNSFSNNDLTNLTVSSLSCLSSIRTTPSVEIPSNSSATFHLPPMPGSGGTSALPFKERRSLMSPPVVFT